MSENTEHKIDRTGWTDGPWSSEPDKIQWTTKAGLPALIVRTRLGHLCGYVGVSKGHTCYGIGENDIRSIDGEWLDVHGGLTYADKCAGAICHVPEPGQTDDVWWLGFDCAHLGDASPGREAMDRKYGWSPDLGVYRTVRYVTAECESLAAQLVCARPVDK